MGEGPREGEAVPGGTGNAAALSPAPSEALLDEERDAEATAGHEQEQVGRLQGP